eukprot:2101663-Prymnesium_polylepis.1
MRRAQKRIPCADRLPRAQGVAAILRVVTRESRWSDAPSLRLLPAGVVVLDAVFDAGELLLRPMGRYARTDVPT